MKLDNISIKLEQSVNLFIIYETDNINIQIKDIVANTNKNQVNKISQDKFKQICKNALSIDEMNYNQFMTQMPNFQVNECQLSPQHWGGRMYEKIVFYLLFTKNRQALKNFYSFLVGDGDFCYCGEKYHLKPDDVYTNFFPSPEKLNKFISEAEAYTDTKLMPYCRPYKNAIDKWIVQFSVNFNEKVESVYGLKITFESNSYCSEKLGDFSRLFINKLVSTYYNQNINSVDSKVSIYQLCVQYNSTFVAKTNPKYTDWYEKYGQQKEEQKVVEYPIHSYHKKIVPREPPKTIDEEIKSVEVKSTMIKSDRKPFKYLYLQKEQKKRLKNYLDNFRNRQNLYGKYGIQYKGGLLLHGEPGCGKSTTILAIGSYLSKDIYYLDLGKIVTNKELQMCIDQIKVNSNGGLIILKI